MILFVHIPKTGGRTINLVAQSCCSACIIDSEFELSKAAAGWPPEPPVQYLGGHCRLSVMEETIAPFSVATPLVRATLLRDPVERAFSLYLFLLRHPSSMRNHWEAVVDKDFDYFWDYGYDNMLWHLQDPQCYLISGARSFEQARSIIHERRVLAGVTEEMPRFYEALRSLAGFAGLPGYSETFVANAAPAAASSAEVRSGAKPANWRKLISPETLRRIERENAADFALFDYVGRQQGGLVAAA